MWWHAHADLPAPERWATREPSTRWQRACWCSVSVGRPVCSVTLLPASDKDYSATIRLGQSTVTDDAEGEVKHAVGPTASAVTESDVIREVVAFLPVARSIRFLVCGERDQGRRGAVLREWRGCLGEEVNLPPRRVTVFKLRRPRRPLATSPPTPGACLDVLDVDVAVTCSSGTYIRRPRPRPRRRTSGSAVISQPFVEREWGPSPRRGRCAVSPWTSSTPSSR